MLGPLRLSMPKIINQMQNYLKYTNKTSGTFSGQCNLQFLSTNVLRGSVATCANYGKVFIDLFTANYCRV